MFYQRLIDDSGYSSIIKIETYNDLIKVYRKTKKDIKLLKEKIADKSLKLIVSPQGVGAILSIVTTSFLVGGFVHNWYVLGHFGIEVSKYFTISDYLASAVEAIRWAAVGSLLSAISLFFGLVRSSRRTYAEAMSASRKTNLFFYALVMMSVAHSIMVYFTNFPSFYKSLSVSAGFLVLIASDQAANRFFKEPLLPLLSMVFLGSFFISLFANACTEIYFLENGNGPNIGSISFNGNLPFSVDGASIITMNSGFIFIIDKNKNVYVLPRQRFEYAKVIPPTVGNWNLFTRYGRL